MEKKECALCGNLIQRSPSKHHLVPKSKGGRETVTLHVGCHRQIHALLSENELRDFYHDIPSLKAHDGIRSYLSWARKHPNMLDNLPTKKSKKNHREEKKIEIRCLCYPKGTFCSFREYCISEGLRPAE